MKLLKKIYHVLVPQTIRTIGGVIRIKKRMKTELEKGQLEEYRNEIEYLLSINKGSAPMIPSPYMNQYTKSDIVVKTDEKYNLPYVIRNGKKLFFPKNMNTHKIIKLYRILMAEQDEHSPHRYFSDFNAPCKDSILVDVGSAEGMIALDYVDKVSKIYLIESDLLWQEALAATFANYSNVVIISAFIGDESTGGIPLIRVIKENVNLIIKMDIEGNELNALSGMKDVLSIKGNKYAVCTYHRYEDEQKIAFIFRENNVQYEFSEGYMFMPSGNQYEFPHLRHGVIRGVKIE